MREGVEVKLARHPETDETVILCRSADRRSKEQAMHDKFSRRIEQALERLSARLARSKKRLDAAAVNRQIGRILQQNQRAAARFTIVLEPDGCPAGFRLRVDHNASFDDWAALSKGAYLLRSNISDWSDRQLWKAYIQLTQAEAAFRIQKDQLNLRPVWHQREDRVQAHIPVASSPSCSGRASRCGNSVRASETRRAPSSKSWPAFSPTTSSCRPRHTGRSAALRRPTRRRPGRALDRLGIVLPKRMRAPENDRRPRTQRLNPIAHQNVVPTFRLRR